MDERIQKYIEKRKEEIALEREKEKQQLLENLKLGERVYSDDSVCTLEYPLFDDSYDAKRKAYKIDTAQTLTEEEYDEIRRISKKRIWNIQEQRTQRVAYFCNGYDVSGCCCCYNFLVLMLIRKFVSSGFYTVYHYIRWLSR